MLRRPKGKEWKVIRSALKAFGSLEFLEDHELMILEKDGKKEVYAFSKDLLKFLNMSGLVLAGIKVGEVGRRFRFTLEGSFYLVRRDRKMVTVNERGEMLFLYGRDVFARSVIDVSEDVRENDVVFVCNLKGDRIGLGRARFDSDRMRKVEGDRVVVDNLLDRGEYLRKKKTYDAV